MDDLTEKLQNRLQTLQKKAAQECGSFQSNNPEADALYSNLIDSLTTTLHNLPVQSAVEKHNT